MTEDIKPEVIKKTQDVLGKYIKKPALTEKLLKKPPFRFLHDICTAVMRETGFFEGVLNSVDSKAENIKDKEAKIAFLLKVIGAVEAANGVKLSVKPSKVVAGHEPTKTNEFLQALGRALEKQVENGNSTKTGQQSKTKTKTTKRPIKEEPPGKKKTTSTKQKTQKPIENGTDDPSAKSKIKPQPDENSPSPIKNSHKKSEKISPTEEDSVILENSTAKPKNGQNGILEENGERENRNGRMKSSKHRRSLEGGDSIDIQNEDEPQISGMNGQGDQNEDSKTPYNHEEVKRPNSARPGHRKPSAQQSIDRAKPSDPITNGHDEPDKFEKQDSTLDKVLGDKIDSINRSESVLGDRVKNTPSPPELPSHRFPKKDIREGSASKNGAIPSHPRSAIRPTTSRPASARPAAPRIRDRGEVAIQEEVIKPASGQVKVIVEKDSANDHDEDENLVSLEITNEILSEPVPVTSTIGNASSEQTEHGHLVEQILETQKELEGPFSEKKTGKTEIEWESGRNRESTYREVERLRASIQTLTRSANPLGKLLDFLQEDIDTMQRELETWKEMNSNLSVQIHQERSLTEQSIEPLKIHLKELQQSIDVQLEQISVVKANIIRNDQKINKLLTGI